PVSVEAVEYPPSTAAASAVHEIVPAYPPPPTPRNRLFQTLGRGSQISMLIAGAITIETSQKGGRPFIGGNAWGGVSVGTKPAGSGGWNVPPGNDFAVIEATSGSTRLPKLSQVLAADTAGTAATAVNRTAEDDSTLNGLIIGFPPLH